MYYIGAHDILVCNWPWTVRAMSWKTTKTRTTLFVSRTRSQTTHSNLANANKTELVHRQSSKIKSESIDTIHKWIDTINMHEFKRRIQKWELQRVQTLHAPNYSLRGAAIHTRDWLLRCNKMSCICFTYEAQTCDHSSSNYWFTANILAVLYRIHAWIDGIQIKAT